MAELFTFVGLISIGLVGVTRWLEEHQASPRRIRR
jgi:hypothetical protein